MLNHTNRIFHVDLIPKELFPISFRLLFVIELSELGAGELGSITSISLTNFLFSKYRKIVFT